MSTLVPPPIPPQPAVLSWERLRAVPPVCQALTGLPPDAFAALLADLAPRYAAAERVRLARPDRQHAIGAGHPFALPLADRVVLAILWLRYRPLDWFLANFFGVSEITAWRARRRIVPVLDAVRPADLAPRPPVLTRRRARRLAAQVPGFSLLNTFAVWARGPLPAQPERPRPTKSAVASPISPLELLQRRIEGLRSASPPATS